MSTKRSYILKQTVAFICRFIYFLKMLQFIFWLSAFMKHTFFNLEIFIPSFALSTNECFSRPCQRKAARKKWAKNEVFHWGFLQQMWPNPQETADLVTFTEEILYGKLRFCAVSHHGKHPTCQAVFESAQNQRCGYAHWSCVIMMATHCTANFDRILIYILLLNSNLYLLLIKMYFRTLTLNFP